MGCVNSSDDSVKGQKAFIVQVWPEQIKPEQNSMTPPKDPELKEKQTEKKLVEAPIIKSQGVKAEKVTPPPMAETKKFEIKGKTGTISTDNRKKVEVAGGMKTDQVSANDDILAHYLEYESLLSEFANPDTIRRRLVVLHYIFQGAMGLGSMGSRGLLMKSWQQRVFLDCMEEAARSFIKLGLPYEQVRKQIAERYLFENYQMNEFRNCGSLYIRGKNALSFMTAQEPLSSICQTSDFALYSILNNLKARFPQYRDKSKTEYPQVSEFSDVVDMISNIPNCKSYVNPSHMNFNTSLFDLQFLIERALSELSDFKDDIKALLGEEGLVAGAKVVNEGSEADPVYNASAIRRVLIKWVETMFKKMPGIRTTNMYQKFVSSKSLIYDNFHLRTEFSQSIHRTVMEILLEIIEIAKYRVGSSSTYERNPHFGFYIYDLLRCRVIRKTPTEVITLLDTLLKTKTAKSGRKLRVIRVKNRFATDNRDVMVNFCYGDVIVAEAQLCVLTNDLTDQDVRSYKFNHYLYELERGLFGPTVELMMQYQDFCRPDQKTRLFWKGNLEPRSPNFYTIGNTSVIRRKCPCGHEMIIAQGNFSSKASGFSRAEKNTYRCDFCLGVGTKDDPYIYCEKCSIYNCMRLSCLSEVTGIISRKQSLLESCDKDTSEFQIAGKASFTQILQAKKGLIGVFYHPELPACIVLRDFILILNNRKLIHGQNLGVAFINVSQPENREMMKQYLPNDSPSLPISILFNNNGKALKTIVGASIPAFQDLCELQARSIANGNQVLQQECRFFLCPNKPTLEFQNSTWPSGAICCQCLNIPVDDKEPAKQLEGWFNCPSCRQALCRNCGFLGFKEPTSYQDPQGATYLSSKPIYPKILTCQRGHSMTYRRSNPTSSSRFECCKCRMEVYFSRQYGLGHCQQCSQYTCPKCLGIVNDTASRYGKEINSYFLEASAPEMKKCTGCNSYLKKVYTERSFEQGTTSSNENVFADFLKRQTIFNEWNCCSCQRSFRQGKLHVACVSCNYEMCLECVDKVKLFKKKQKQSEVDTQFICPKNHRVKRSFKSPKPGQPSVTCSCTNVVYPNSEHFICPTCNEFWCRVCANQKLKIPESVCQKGHTLEKIDKNPTGLAQYCGFNKNHIILKDQPFITCLECEGVVYCQKGKCKGSNIPNELRCFTGEKMNGILSKRPFVCINEPCLSVKSKQQRIISDYLGCLLCLQRKRTGFSICWACFTAKRFGQLIKTDAHTLTYS